MTRRPQPWLDPLGRVYLQLAAWHHRRYDRQLRPVHHAPAPVISVGNVTVGGSGKTPTTLWIARRLMAAGMQVGIVSRGYGGVRGEEPLVVAAHGRIEAGSETAGDEAAMIAGQLPNAIVVVGSERHLAAERACGLGAQAIVLDDGFQHRRLHRDLDIVLLDAQRPFGNRRGLPAGPLREKPAALVRADLILLTRAPDDLVERRAPLQPDLWPLELREAFEAIGLADPPPVLACRHRPTGLIVDGDRVSLDWLAGQAVLAVSGIARPESFEATLEQLGARLAGTLRFADHHRFSAADGQRIATALCSSGADAIVTTTKDAVRWPDSAPAPAQLSIEIDLGRGADALSSSVLGAAEDPRWLRNGTP